MEKNCGSVSVTQPPPVGLARLNVAKGISIDPPGSLWGKGIFPYISGREGECSVRVDLNSKIRLKTAPNRLMENKKKNIGGKNLVNHGPVVAILDPVSLKILSENAGSMKKNQPKLENVTLTKPKWSDEKIRYFASCTQNP